MRDSTASAGRPAASQPFRDRRRGHRPTGICSARYAGTDIPGSHPARSSLLAGPLCPLCTAPPLLQQVHHSWMVKQSLKKKKRGHYISKRSPEHGTRSKQERMSHTRSTRAQTEHTISLCNQVHPLLSRLSFHCFHGATSSNIQQILP